MVPGDGMTLAPRHCGPPGMANGGVACGSLALLLGAPAEVTLRRPVPLGRVLQVRDGGGGITLHDGDALLAEARPAPAEVALAVPEDVTLDQARAAAGRSRYYGAPRYPRCFVCGPARAPGDGLRIFPGPVPGRGVLAAPWIPDASAAGAGGRVRPEAVWAALDCPSGLAAMEGTELGGDTTALLGRMTATVGAVPDVGAACRVIAWPLGRDGRKLTAGSALLGPAGGVLAAARTVWVAVPDDRFDDPTP
jgi:hypothetical protein